MDEDENLFRPPWEEGDAPAHRTSGRSTRASEAPLLPLARAQDAVTRLKASLRKTNLEGSYTLAALTGRLREAAPWTTAGGGAGRSPTII